MLLRVEQLLHPLAQGWPVLAVNVVVGAEVEQRVLSCFAIGIDALDQAVSGVVAAFGLGADFGLSDKHGSQLYSNLGVGCGGFGTFWHCDGGLELVK